MAEKPTLIVVTGPTASGKTACAVRLCKRIGGEVISADSMQIYRDMEVLSAAPTAEEREGVPHHLIGIADPTEKYTVSMYREAAMKAIADIRACGKVPVVCGGTGLYIDALTRSFRFSEKSDETMHAELLAIADEPGGKRKLHDMLETIDPVSAAKFHENDIRRVARAIEVFRLTGTPQSAQTEEDSSGEGPFNETIFAISWPREELYERIDRRVDGMIAAGLIPEVERLMGRKELLETAAQAIGFKEIASALEGRMDMTEAIDKVKIATRHYAKRQLTWLRRDGRSVAVEAMGKSTDEIAAQMEQILTARV